MTTTTETPRKTRITVRYYVRGVGPKQKEFTARTEEACLAKMGAHFDRLAEKGESIMDVATCTEVL